MTPINMEHGIPKCAFYLKDLFIELRGTQPVLFEKKKRGRGADLAHAPALAPIPLLVIVIMIQIIMLRHEFITIATRLEN